MMSQMSSTPVQSSSAQSTVSPTQWQTPSWLKGFGAGSPQVPKLAGVNY